MKKMRMEPGEMMKYVSDFSEILLESQEQNGTILLRITLRRKHNVFCALLFGLLT